MLREMYQVMSVMTDQNQWGEYAFSRDILQNRIEEAEKSEMIQQAIQCGCDFAEWLMSEYKDMSAEEIVRSVNIRLVDSEAAVMGERVLFAQYTPPNEVMIMEEPLKKYGQIREKENLQEVLPSAAQIRQLLLGHELFHWVEEQYQDIIYTRKKKITLWKLWRYENQSTVRALGELAAMYFSQTLNQITYSPFVVDVLLSYSYNPELARNIYNDILMSVEKEKKEENL